VIAGLRITVISKMSDVLYGPYNNASCF